VSSSNGILLHVLLDECYRKSYIFRSPVAKPIPFMAPEYVALEEFTFWQAQVGLQAVDETDILLTILD
jgi:hypothetical protein